MNGARNHWIRGACAVSPGSRIRTPRGATCGGRVIVETA